MARQLHLNVFVLGVGHHAAAWRHPDVDPVSHLDVEVMKSIARTAEAGKFDAVFYADAPSLSKWSGEVGRAPDEKLDPALMLTAMATATSKVGLIATASTQFEEPYNVARRFATLDLLSRGRAGWNMVTGMIPESALNFGYPQMPTHEERYRRGEEFLEVVVGLWGEWDDDVLVADKSNAVYARRSRIHDLRHAGSHFSVAGPLSVPRSPQGWPVVVQAGSSGKGMDLAARHADVVFTAQNDFNAAREFYRDLKGRAAALGRDPDSIAILPGLATYVGVTDEEADGKKAELDALVSLDDGLKLLSSQTGIPVRDIDPDAPLPTAVRDPADYHGNRSRYELTLALAHSENLTVRQLLVRLAGSRAHSTVVGSAQTVADHIQVWFEGGACDGFNLMPATLPMGLSEFVDTVVPVLQERGIFRRDYAGSTLREHLGIPVPAPRGCVGDPAEAALDQVNSLRHGPARQEQR